MKLKVTSISGAREGESWSIDQNSRKTFGRTSASDVSFEDDGHMSSRHFEIINAPTGCEVVDSGSTNGTWLNSHRIDRAVLKDGDFLKVGKTLLKVELEAKKGLNDPPAHSDSGRASIPVSGSPVTGTNFEREHGYSEVPVEEKPIPVVEEPSTKETPLPKSRSPIMFSMDMSPPVEPAAPVNPFESGDFDSFPSSPSSVRPAADSPIDSVPYASSTESAKEKPARFREREGRAEASPVAPSSVTGRNSAKVSDNPFGSIFESEEPVVENIPVKPVAPPILAVGEYVFMRRRIGTPLEDGFSLLASLVMKRFSLKIVADFQKIRMEIPEQLKRGAVSLFPWYDASGLPAGPLLFDGIVMEAPPFKSVLSRLLQSDALMAFFGEEPDAMQTRMQSMVTTGIPGFSEQGGVLTCFWPSSFQSLVRLAGVRVCNQLFGSAIVGTMFGSPGQRPLIEAVAGAEMSAILGQREFELVDP